MRLAFQKIILATSLVVFSLTFGNGFSEADEFQYFRNIAGGSTGTAGWDRFQGATYNGPHSPDAVSTEFAGATFSVNNNGGGAGFLTGSLDLYSFFSTPIWQISGAGMVASQPFTSVALQFASTPDQAGGILDATDFMLNGNQADRFAVVGQFSDLTAGGGQPAQPVYYYWAAWDVLSASSSYSLEVGPPAQNHTVAAAARIDYVNTSNANYLITAVPEPTVLWMVPLVGLAIARNRRRHLQA